jgi:hypothetical protein
MIAGRRWSVTGPLKSPGVILFAWGMSAFNDKGVITVVVRPPGSCAQVMGGAPIRERTGKRNVTAPNKSRQLRRPHSAFDVRLAITASMSRAILRRSAANLPKSSRFLESVASLAMSSQSSAHFRQLAAEQFLMSRAYDVPACEQVLTGHLFGA